MERHTFHLSLLAVLLSGSAALAQVDPGPPPLPTPPTDAMPPAGAPSLGLPAYPATAPFAALPAQAVYPPPGPPPGQPASPPTAPYVLVPVQPAPPPLVVCGPEPSSLLGLMLGDNTTHWDISVDALWLQRDAGKSVPLGDAGYSYGPLPSQVVQTDSLWSDDVVFPLAPGIRVQLIGRMSDQMAIEATGWGLQQWSVGRTIYGDAGGGTVVNSPWLQMADFDNALGYTYGSQVANVELNQRFKLYSFDPYRAFSWLWGVRYFYLSDDFTLGASDLATGDYENYNWRTTNNLIGMQLGVQWAWGWNRFQMSSEAKFGLFANVYSQRGSDSGVGPAGFQPFDAAHSGTDLATLFELSFLLRYRMTPATWLRAGYQFYGVSGLALGPRQLSDYDNRGSVGLDGLSLGLEWTH